MSKAHVAIVFLAIASGGALLWWRHQRPERPIAAAAPVRAPAPQPPQPSAPPPPAIRYPVPPVSSKHGGRRALDDSNDVIERALVELLGRKAVVSFLHLDGFVRDFVATVNNLATDSAASQLWPVKPMAGHFEAEVLDGEVVIGPENADRYRAFVHFAEGVDTARAVGLYERLYPLFQSAYEELGYPGKYFNDRVIDVIDDLLATPTTSGAVKIKRIGADGGASANGALYIFEDPSLEARSAGQKILLRMGPENAAVLRAKLKDVRERLVTGARAHPAR